MVLAFAGILTLAGCGGGAKTGAGSAAKPIFFGAVVSPERNAGVVARNVLTGGGDAADAAVALGFSLAVTLPSRAGLGGGGACLAYDPAPNGPGKGKPEAILFAPNVPASGESSGAAVPMMARGLFLLHARYGRLPIAQLLGEAQAMAEFGTRVSPALARDLASAPATLFADPAARAVFASPSGAPLRAGEVMRQPELATVLSGLRVNGIGPASSRTFGGGLALGASGAGLAQAAPRIAEPIVARAGNNRVAFLTPPAGRGSEAALMFHDLWRDPGAVPAEKSPPNAQSNAQSSPSPASAAYAVLDTAGNAVACAVTMNGLFGTGRIVPGTGILLAASPARAAPPLDAALAWNNNLHAFRAEVAGSVTGSGGDDTALAVARAMLDALRKKAALPAGVPPRTQASVITCSKWLPGNPASCTAAIEPSGSGGYTAGG